MTTSTQEKKEDGGQREKFVSKLEHGPQRFLAHVLEHGLEIGRRQPADFIRHFPPSAIMEGLKSRPGLRADILEATTNVYRKIALKKSAETAAEDVQIALDEKVASAEDIVSSFGPDDRVRYLDRQKLWAYVVEGKFWTTDPGRKKEFERAKQHVAFILDRALEDRLISHEDLIAGVSVEKLSESLPRAQLANIINEALALGKQKKPFTEEALLEAAAARVLVEDVSLEHLWETVIEPKIAAPHGFVEQSPPREDATAEVASPAPAEKEAAPAKASKSAKSTNGAAAKASKRSNGKAEKAAEADEKAAEAEKTAGGAEKDGQGAASRAKNGRESDSVEKSIESAAEPAVEEFELDELIEEFEEEATQV